MQAKDNNSLQPTQNRYAISIRLSSGVGRQFSLGSTETKQSMIDISVEQDSAVFEVLGLHKFWALKRQLKVPLSHIHAVRADPSVKLGWAKAWRWPGTYIPGLIRAGTYYRKGHCSFWDVVRPSGCIIIDLENEPYEQLVLEVREPEAEVQRLEAAIPKPNR